MQALLLDYFKIPDQLATTSISTLDYWKCLIIQEEIMAALLKSDADS